MKYFLEKRDRWGHGVSLWVLVVAVFAIPLALWSLSKVKMHNDVANWLPKDDQQARILDWSHEQFTTDERFLVSWPDSSLTDARLERLARRLEGNPDKDGIRRGGSPYFAGVATPQKLLLRITNRDVELEEALDRINGILIGSGPLRIQLTDIGRRDPIAVARSLKHAVQAELGIEPEITMGEDLAAADGEVDERLFADDDDFVEDEESIKLRDDLAGYAARIPDFDFTVRWPTLHTSTEQRERFVTLAREHRVDEFGNNEPVIADCFFYAGEPAAMALTLSEAGAADRKAAFAQLDEIAASVGIPPESLKLGGSPVARTALNNSVKKALWNCDHPAWNLPLRSPILCSTIVGAVLAFVMLRSIRLVILVTAMGYYAELVATSLVPVTGGSMNMVLVVMPCLLMVLTVSAAIHLVNYWKHAAQDKTGNAVIRAVIIARTPCAWAGLTTAIGLISLATSPLIPVRDFGIYSAIGCVLSVLIVLYLLPTLMQYWPSPAPAAREIDNRAWKRLGQFLARHCHSVAAACLVAGLASTWGLTYFRTETKVIRYFPDETRVVQDYNYLEQNLAGIIPVETIVRFQKRATRLDDENRRRRLNFFERTEIVRRIQDRFRELPDISGTLSLASFMEARQPPAKNASLLRVSRWARGSQHAERNLRESTNPDTRRFIAFPDEATDLDQPGDHKLNAAGDELWRITAQVAIMTDLDYGDLIDDLNRLTAMELRNYNGADHQVTGMVPVFLRTQQAVLDSLITSFGLAFCVIGLGITILLRNPLAGFLTMLPNLFPVAVVFGLISWFGMRVDIGTMITASVALGIAVDGTLHLLTWFRKHIEAGDSRDTAMAEALGHCAPAMWQTSAIVGLGILALFPTELLLISRFGWLMAALIGTALVADIVFLPALLAGPLGALIERTVKSSQDPTLPRKRGTSVPEPHVNVEATGPGENLSAHDTMDTPQSGITWSRYRALARL